MKTIGLIGGMSWESTVHYYRQINEAVRDRLGGLHSARIVLYSVDFHDIERLQHAGDWREAGATLAAAARTLQTAGADFLVLCTNTMHKVSDAIEAAAGIPLLHIADPTAIAIRRAGHSRVGLLGTRFTMEEDFYRDRLVRHHGLEVIVPEADAREAVHRIIYAELCQGIVRDESREEYRRIMTGLVARGAQAIILGCTEISLLVTAQDSAVPLFDTTALHALAAAEQALQRIEIRIDDLRGPEIRALLEQHLADMRRISPPESVHALDLEALRRPDITFWTAWDGADLLGCGALRELDGAHGEVKSMRTTPAHRGRGVAQAMIEHILSQARRRGYARLSLETGAQVEFEPAHRLYARNGFAFCGPFGDYSNDPNSVFMSRTLAGLDPRAAESRASAVEPSGG